jgi:hypothetical protein
MFYNVDSKLDNTAWAFVGGEEQLAGDKIIKKPEDSCGVAEKAFPCLCKCCAKSSSLTGDAYKKNCLHCSIWTSMPDGASLAITHIFECSLHGYVKRIKN